MELAYREDGRNEGYSIAFFCLSNFIIAIILLNLLLMVILQQYDEFHNKNYNPIDEFNSFLTDFNNAWNKFSAEEDEGHRIKKIFTTQLFMNFNWDILYFPEKNKLEYIKKYVTDLKLFIDKDNYVYYHDVIFKIIYNQMGLKIERNTPENNLIFKTEKDIQLKIKNFINNFSSRRKEPSNQKQKNVLITYNPMTAHLYYKLSFMYLKTFINNYKENLDLLNHLKESNSPRLNTNESFESNESSESQSDQSNSNSKSNSNSISNSKSNSNSISKSKSISNDNKAINSVIKSSINEEDNSNSKSNSKKINNNENKIENSIKNNSKKNIGELINKNETNIIKEDKK
jgi:hypothetical protein